MATAARYFAKNLIFQCRKVYFYKSSSRCFSQSPIVYTSRKFSERHEWITVEGNIGTVGISLFAQTSLGDVVYVELPEIGKQLVKDDEVGVVESVKAANEYYSPVGGTVTEVNKQLEEKPSTINESCYDEGWIYKLELLDRKELDDLMEEDAYQKYLKEMHS